VVAPFICYDLRFPEHFRTAARHGAQLITVIASWPIARIQHWVTLLQARAIENQAYVAGTNRCGTDPKFTYTGRSLIVSPKGEILADAGNAETVISADLSLDDLLAYRKDLPFLADMRA
jgi:predicted amidohydrolase